MSSQFVHHQLLFGLLALKNEFIDSRQLLRAFDDWAAEKRRSLAELLLAAGVLQPADVSVVESLVNKFVERHGGDLEASLAAVSAVGLIRQQLQQTIADPDVQASLRYVTNDDQADLFRTNPVGQSTSEGSRFQILRLHARGGLGEVYEAEDTELRRKVALKTIQPHQADSPDSRARFVREAEITGGLEHPGIVPVYGIGVDRDGRPFYAMRFVRGDSLQEAIAKYHTGNGNTETSRQLAFRELLGHLVSVCDAIEYAHDRGVLHRDLKPANIMLGKYGETLVVDWGLAKAQGLDMELGSSDESLLIPVSGSGSAPTVHGSALGTPAFMSPEQARGELDQLDRRSDVYSLGASLYVLLTGRPAFTDNDIRQLLKRVQAGDYPPPRQIRPAISAALEAVCLKAMSLRAEDRYSTCRQLADDIERYLADEPVSVYTEPLAARMLRWGRRHKPLVTGGTVLLLTTVVGLSVGLLLLGRKQAEVVQQRNVARQARDQAEAINKFYEDHVLAAARPKSSQRGRGKDVTLTQALDDAAPKIEQAFAGRPELEAAVRNTLGMTYWYLGLFDAADPHLEKAFGLRLESLGPDDDATLTSQINLALQRWRQGKIEEAVSLAREAHRRRRAQFGAEHQATLWTQLNLGLCVINTGEYAEAEALLRDAVDACRRTLGADHHHTLYGQNDLAVALSRQGRDKEAAALNRQTLEGRRRSLGADDPDTLRSMDNLAGTLSRVGEHAEAESLCRRGLEGRRRVLGDEHVETFWSQRNLAHILRAQEKLAEAELLYRQTRDAQRRLLGPDHPEALGTDYFLAYTCDLNGKTSEAEQLFRELLVIQRRSDQPDKLPLASTLAAVGDLLNRTDRAAEAEPMLRESLALRERKLPAGSWQIANTQSVLGDSLSRQQQFDAAEPVLLTGYGALSAAPHVETKLITAAQNRIIELYKSWGKPDQAAQWQAKFDQQPPADQS